MTTLVLWLKAGSLAWDNMISIGVGQTVTGPSVEIKLWRMASTAESLTVVVPTKVY